MTTPRPRHRLSTRVVFMFLLAAAPAWLATGAAVVALDQLAAQEIEARGRSVRAALARHLETEQVRLQKALDRVAEDPEIARIARRLDASDLRIFEGVAAGLAASEGLDVLAVVANAGPWQGLLLSSAHLAEAVEDPAPAFVTAASEPTVGLVYETVDGNPVQRVPALVAVRGVRSGADRTPELKIYGGLRLDGTRLEGLAEMSDAQLILRAPGLRNWPFGTPAPEATRAGLALPFIDRGTVGTPKPIKATEAILDIRVRSPRLARARQQVLRWAPMLVGGSFLLAIALSWMLSRRIAHRIRTLSTAAEKVATGDLSIRVEPRGRDEVGHLMAVFNHMTEELSDSREKLRRAERAAAWQQIARRVAHEIKNPLFPIQMSIETLQKSYDKQHPKLSEIVRESTKTVLEEVQALNRLVTEFSKFARLPPPAKSDVPVIQLLTHVSELYGADDRVQVDLSSVESENLPDLHVDRDQMNRVLINLVKNGIEALGEHPGTVRLGAHRGPQGTVALTVEDTGPGMTPSVQDEIFTPYFTTKPEGTGLGLAIVDRIVAEHGGEVIVRSTASGTTFTLRLPTPSPAPSH